VGWQGAHAGRRRAALCSCAAADSSRRATASSSCSRNSIWYPASAGGGTSTLSGQATCECTENVDQTAGLAMSNAKTAGGAPAICCRMWQ
jgi:hypothetical protein